MLLNKTDYNFQIKIKVTSLKINLIKTSFLTQTIEG